MPSAFLVPTSVGSFPPQPLLWSPLPTPGMCKWPQALCRPRSGPELAQKVCLGNPHMDAYHPPSRWPLVLAGLVHTSPPPGSPLRPIVGWASFLQPRPPQVVALRLGAPQAEVGLVPMPLAMGRCSEGAKGVRGEPRRKEVCPPPAPCLLFREAWSLPG